jgi:peptide/nickel transport system substrate-binding protein
MIEITARTALGHATLVAAASLLCACGGGSGDTAAEPGSAGPAASAIDINATPRDRLRDGGTFTWALAQIPTNFNYYQIDGTLQDNADVISALMPIAFRTDGAGVAHWNEALLAEEPVLTTEPTQVVTYRINPDAIWYDGTPITWEDFYWQWRASSGTNEAYTIGSSNGYEEIENVERGADDREVRVTFMNRYADWQALFTPLYPASTNSDPDVFNAGWIERPLTTAGPFKLGEINRTTQTITLVPNERWWGDPPRLDAIVFRAIDISAQIDALANGEIDAMDIGPDANMYRRALNIAGVEIRAAGGPNFRHLTINSTSVVLDDVRVRQALAMAIDRDAIARALLGPLGIAPQVLGNHIFMANQDGYRDNSGDVGRYAPDEAGRLLDEAGWVLEGGVRMKDGQPLEITAVIPAAVQATRQEMELIQNMLAQIGVTVDIDTVPIGDFFDQYVTPGQFDFTIFSWMGTPFPVSSSKSIYSEPQTDSSGQLQIQQNYARNGSAEIDALLDAASTEFDKERAQDLANRADALIWETVHSLTLYQRPELIAVKQGLANFGAFGLSTPWTYEDIGWVSED